MNTQTLQSKGSNNNQHRVAVVGLGYVGLPLAIAFVEAGVEVVGLDTRIDHVRMLNTGISSIDDISSERLAAAVQSQKFTVTVDPDCLETVTAILICVPTPLTRQRTPDMQYVESAARTVAMHLRHDQLVVLESTTYPGTTEELVKAILESRGLRAGEDFWLAFSPERIDPGAVSSPQFTLENTPKVIGGLTHNCTDRAMSLYGLIARTLVPVNAPRIAEMAKLFENIFRNVNIALVNELAMVCDCMGINVWEVLDAAATKPFGFMRFNPGPGVGGHCIPVDPFYLTWKAREYGFHTRFIELAGEINGAMPHYVVHRIMQELNSQHKSLNGSRILVLGVAYKPNVADIRESPAVRVVQELLAHGAIVKYHDPHVSEVTVAEQVLSSVLLTSEELNEADCVAILTDHDAVDYGLVVDHAQSVIDTRNRLRIHDEEALIKPRT